jgi:hypothetical protein
MAVKYLLAVSAIAISLAMPSLSSAQTNPVYSLDFSGFPGGSVLSWLGTKGFVPKQDAGNSRKVTYAITQDGLVLETKTRAQAFLLNERDIPGARTLRVQWGVNVFPPGASYEKGVRSEAVMVYVFFGKERHASGSVLVPNSPYFIGFFLCESGSTNVPFKGRYYQATGRYVCVDRPSAGATVTSDIPVGERFMQAFGKAAPEISGVAIAIDTASAKGSGVAQSFVRKIEFLP